MKVRNDLMVAGQYKEAAARAMRVVGLVGREFHSLDLITCRLIKKVTSDRIWNMPFRRGHHI